MHDNYAGKFNPYFTFDQTAVSYKTPSDSSAQVWHEAMAFPGNW
ncbi:hypothetical protein [Rufibacter tibetensis]|nr:hypothetical protein [Rufibacter tibetensis]